MLCEQHQYMTKLDHMETLKCCSTRDERRCPDMLYMILRKLETGQGSVCQSNFL